ncbi:hypothetical protein EV646_105420 [Kribbella antiqua]|uniref:Uncharacterized protein n=1 Tax=Kribbella antiqua TaxID=2512217 RepID=A0A4R2ITI7_9ACTN|nr:hypothetical protein [Kribbella antiqua]TCO47862.1 hypothetical protein EV646_105420 [Kribbella antiqua]
MITLSEDDYEVEFSVPRVPEPENWLNVQSITTHPDFPTDPSAPLISPFIAAAQAFGGDFPKFGEMLGSFHSFADQKWPVLERAYGFYLKEDWPLFDRAMSELLDGEWPENPSMLQRYDVLHRVIAIGLLPLGPGGEYLAAKQEIWAASPATDGFVGYCASMDDAELAGLQRRLFDQIRRMIGERAIWSPALALMYLDIFKREAPSGWRLPGEDFHILRDAYQQSYELCSQALYLLVAAKNVEEGRDATKICAADYSSGWVPQIDGNQKKLPKTIAQFKKLTSELKELYLEKFPVTRSVWDTFFNRRTRNAIAHADVDFVVSSGMITTGKGDELTYIDFVKSTVGQLQMLILFTDYVKLCRIYGHWRRAIDESPNQPT